MSPTRLAESILDAIGSTPVVRIKRIVPRDSAELYAKLESFNPMGSVKDRIARGMVEDGERRGVIREGTTLIEPTSGNTGIGLAMVCAVKGYKLVLTMPDTMSVERRKLLTALGAEIVLTPGQEGMKGAIDKAEELAAAVGDAVVLRQFANPSNPMTHERTTAVEISEAMDSLHAFVSGVGTGGTITGVGRVLRKRFPGIRIIAVEPSDSPVLSGGKPGSHGIQGIGAGFIPEVLDTDMIDSVLQVSFDEARRMTRALAGKEGIFAGISSGAAVHGAVEVASDLGPGKKVLVLLPDTGERYLSTDLFGE
ncbi:MAG: cysteine synthase A [Methanobacteriota archaeon]|nr:MAG: cysteine synthase A [Euryarchaeota archaeon]